MDLKAFEPREIPIGETSWGPMADKIDRILDLGDGVLEIHGKNGTVVRATPKQELFESLQEASPE